LCYFFVQNDVFITEIIRIEFTTKMDKIENPNIEVLIISDI